MLCKTNLTEKLHTLTENLKECQLSGFRYAPTASSDIEIPAVFCFESLHSRNHRNAAQQSVSNVGFLDLQTFRNERRDSSDIQVLSNNNNGGFNNPQQISTSASSIHIIPSIPIVQAPVDTTFLDSELMDLDLDALVAAELAKQESARFQKEHEHNNIIQNPPSGTTNNGMSSIIHSSRIVQTPVAEEKSPDREPSHTSINIPTTATTTGSTTATGIGMHSQMKLDRVKAEMDRYVCDKLLYLYIVCMYHIILYLLLVICE